jgi:nitrogenase molybdenum-iron protein alpha/beta subunit
MQHGFKDRMSYLYVDQNDIINGYDDLIFDAVGELFAALAPARPKVLLIFVSCLDDLIGTDHASLAARLSAKYPGVRFRDCHMNPIALDSSVPPGISVQNKMYSLLESGSSGAGERDAAVNSIGNFDAIDPGSELRVFLENYGVGELRHISGYETFDSYQRMGRSRLNLVVNPAGLQAAGQMENSLGIPFIFLPVAYRMENVAQNYRLLGRALGGDDSTPPDLSVFESEARGAARAALSAVGDLPVIVDDSAVTRPFELARALVEYGFNVARVVTGECAPPDEENMRWILDSAPEIGIVQPEHHNSIKFDLRMGRSLAVGLDGAYLAGSDYLLDMLNDAGMYGYYGVTSLMTRMAKAVRRKADLRAVIDSYGLVI